MNKRSTTTRIPILFLFVLLVCSTRLLAQTDVIRGKVTTPEGEPIAGVRVSATSLPGNVTRTAITNPSGQYQIAFPGGSGDYIMGFTYFGYAFKQFELKRLADEDVLVADARLAPMVVDTVEVVAPKQEKVNRNAAQTPDISGTERAVSPTNVPADLRGDIAAMAASMPGVLLVPGLDGDADGFSVLGLSPDQNNVTLNGLPTTQNNLPRDASVTSTLTTSPYDVSRGGFSGANFNVRSRSGSNFKTRGLSLVGTAPQMQWTDRAAQAIGTDYTNISLGGVTSGAIKLNKSFYNLSFQLGRQSRDNQTLLNTNALGLQAAGVANDSVLRFTHLLQQLRVPFGGVHASKFSDNGTAFGSFDFAPPNSNSGTAMGITINGGWRKQAPAIGGITQLESSSGDRTNWNAGVQGRHSRYIGLVLSETSLGFNTTHDYGEPYLSLPSGRVRVSSVFADGTTGVQSLAFGGNQGLSTSTQNSIASFKNELSWFDNANKHRIRLTTDLQYNNTRSDLSSNLLGSFYFNSLADLEAGTPASFTRTLAARVRSTGVFNGAIALGDSYRRSADLQFTYGLRVETSRFTTTPSANPLVESTFARRNDNMPNAFVFSPRIGMSWTVGRSNEIASFLGAAPVPRAVVRAGIGVFSNGAQAGQAASVFDNTGLPSGARQIVCIGPATPVPDWNVYATSPSAIPSTCADGSNGTVFSTSSPNVTLFAEDFAPQRNIRSNISWDGRILGNRFSLNAEATYSLNLNQQRFVDLNFNPQQRFSLRDDNRPVFVSPTSIVSTTGAIAAGDARMSSAFARVTELRSDLKSHTAQLQLRLNPVFKGPTKFGWNLAYTYQHVREQVSGFSSTDSNPFALAWTPSSIGPHSFNYTLRYSFFNAVTVSWTGTFRSGTAFTPTVAGDINGDGYSNDRAFIYSPTSTTADPKVAQGMRDLLAVAPDGTRRCLEKQVNTIAARNSCRGPWQSTAFLNISLDRAKFHMPQRGEVSFSLSNPLGAADLLLNGSGNLKGWGQTSFQDPSLLYVRGFDAATSHYIYEVNQRFGASRPQLLTLRNPVTLTATMRFDLGPTREKQMLHQQLAVGRTLPGTPLPEQMFRMMTANNVGNPVSQILRSQDTLQLTAMQADSIATMNRTYTYRSDSLWTPIARKFAKLEKQYDEGAAYDQYLNARRHQVEMMTTMANAVRALLTPQQKRKLPSYIVNMLDPRYLALTRDGTPLYISGGGGGFGPGVLSFESFGGPPMIMF